jgi:hypothetical protein
MPSGAVSLVDGAVIGMYLHGVGALIAIIGGVMFVLTIFSALKGRESLQGQPLRFNARHP